MDSSILGARDRLNRAPLARRIGALVSAADIDAGLMVAIVGQPGSGRSWLINEVARERLANGGHTVHFETALLDVSGRDERMAKCIARARTASYDTQAPEKAARAGVSGGSLSALRRRLAASRWGRTRPAERQALGARAARQRPLAVVDDVDRLPDDDARAVLELAQRAAASEKLAFLVSCRPGLADVLHDASIAITLAQPNEAQVEQAITAALRDTLVDCVPQWRAADDQRWSALLTTGFVSLFASLSQGRLYLSGLRLSLRCAPTVNVVDLACAEALRFIAPAVYGAVSVSKAFLCAGPPEGEYAMIQRRALYEGIIHPAPGPARIIVDKLCKVMFPQLQNVPATERNRANWRAEHRACTAEAFDRYFLWGTQQPRVSVSEVMFARDAARYDNAWRSLVRRYLADDRLELLLAALLKDAYLMDAESVARIVDELATLSTPSIAEPIAPLTPIWTYRFGEAYMTSRGSDSERASFLRVLRVRSADTKFHQPLFATLATMSQPHQTASQAVDTIVQ